MKNENWFSARCLFEYAGTRDKERCATYEERIIVLEASSLDDAIMRAEGEAHEYACEGSGAVYTGFVDVYHLADSKIGDGAEVFSLMRDSALGREEYIDRFFDTGAERAQRAADG